MVEWKEKLEELGKSKIVIQCETRKDSIELLSKLDSLGYRWHSRCSLLLGCNWDTYTSFTCYHIDGDSKTVQYSPEDYFSDLGYKIIKFKEFKLFTRETSFTKHGFKNPTTFKGEICFQNEEEGYSIGYIEEGSKKHFRQWNRYGYCYNFEGFEETDNDLELLKPLWYQNEQLSNFLIISNAGSIQKVREIKDNQVYCAGNILTEGIIKLNGWRPVKASDNITDLILEEY